VYDLDRTHPLGHDLDWLPRELKLLRWGVSAGAWVGITGLAVATTALSGGALANLSVLGAVGGIYASGRFARALMLRRLGRLARGRLEIVRLGAEPEGRLAHVTGRVLATASRPSFLHGVPAVYRRLVFRLGGTRYIHEAAVDFEVVDGDGERLRVHVNGAHLFLPPSRELADYPAALFTERPPAPSLSRVIGARGERFTHARTVLAAEWVLAPDAEVDVIGYKTETPDPTAFTRAGRGPPMRVALRSGRIPLIVTPRLPVAPADAL
jgi:hypothetical protein